MLRRLTLGLLLAALVCPGAALATAWKTWTNVDEGFSVTVPSDWLRVPNTVSAVEKLVKQADQAHSTALARVYASLVATAAARTALERTAFQAFAYSTEPILTDVTVAVGPAGASQTTAAGLATLGKTLARSFAAQGRTVAAPRAVTLRSGHAVFVNGAYRVNGATADFAVFVIAHGRQLYELSFHADAGASDIKSLSVTIGRIADGFAFS